MRWWPWILAGCTGPFVEEPAGPVGRGFGNPFPQSALVTEDGRLDLADHVPEPGGPTPLPFDQLGWRRGFSSAQVAWLGGFEVDATALPTVDAIDPASASVQMIDLATGESLPCFAELDAYAVENPTGEVPSLLIRPLTALPEGHEIAVVVTTGAMPRPTSFVADGETTGPLLEALADLGIDPDSIAIAWSFPVADGTAPLRSALSQVEVLGGPTLIADEGATDRSLTFAAWSGTFPVVSFTDDGTLAIADDGTVTPIGEAAADLFVHVPSSVAEAPAGTVPLVVFGHGIFSSPELYLAQDDDGDGVRAFAEAAGVIVVATTWRGLTTVDLAVPLGASMDFGQFPRVPNLLLQAQVNQRTLIEGLRDGTLTDHPAFRGASGQALPDLDRIGYYGISLGAIEGAVLLATEAPLDATAFHVGGAMWSTMLERSSNWTILENGLLSQIESAADRQALYALTQLWWDPVDPMSYVADLRDAPFLFQVSVGDEQVPNLTSDAFARATGLPVIEPAPFVSEGLTSVSLPLDAPARGLVWFDPETNRPPPTNRPAPTTGAHTSPRQWFGARQQVVDYLAPGAEGTLVHHCGSTPCNASNATP